MGDMKVKQLNIGAISFILFTKEFYLKLKLNQIYKLIKLSIYLNKYLKSKGDQCSIINIKDIIRNAIK